jgi:hypothetical protein
MILHHTPVLGNETYEKSEEERKSYSAGMTKTKYI